MNLLYVNGWGINNPLTLASTIPSLEVLTRSKIVTKIILLTPEVEQCPAARLHHNIEHIPVHTRGRGVLSYLLNESLYISQIYKTVKKKKIDKIVARGAPSGGRAAIVASMTGVPYIVESFEPHSNYMLDSNVWKAYDPRYIIQKMWERQIKKTATAVITVSNNYAKCLIDEGMDRRRVFQVPCTVDVESFSKNMADRAQIRGRLGISLADTVGIYVGKFGDIYFSLNDSVSIFKEAFDQINNFQLIVLSDCTKDALFLAVKSAGCEQWLNRIHVLKAPHHQVPMYLSASDFAYSLVKSGPSKKFCSPLKNGEYWANGLPIIVPEDIGDDSDIVLRSGLGVVIRKEENYSYMPKLLDVLSRGGHRGECMALALKYRSRELITKAYEELELY